MSTRDELKFVKSSRKGFIISNVVFMVSLHKPGPVYKDIKMCSPTLEYMLRNELAETLSGIER